MWVIGRDGGDNGLTVWVTWQVAGGSKRRGSSVSQVSHLSGHFCLARIIFSSAFRFSMFSQLQFQTKRATKNASYNNKAKNRLVTEAHTVTQYQTETNRKQNAFDSIFYIFPPSGS